MSISHSLDGGFFGFDLSDPNSLVEALGLTQVAENEDFIRQVTEHMYEVCSENLSAVVLEPNLTAPLLSSKVQKGLILRFDAPLAQDPLALPVLDQNWQMENIAENFASAFLTMYYHPSEKEALLKKQFLAEVYDTCQVNKCDLVLNLVIYTPAEQEFDPQKFANDQLIALGELGKWANLLVLQYPQSALGCATLTAELDQPWVLSGKSFAYEELKDKYRECLENGAKGIMVGDSAYQGIKGEINTKQGLEISSVQKFVANEFRDRMIELHRITSEYQEVFSEKL